MEKVKRTWHTLNCRIDRIWADQNEEAGTVCREKKPCKERLTDFLKSHKWDLLFVLIIGCFLFCMAWILPFNKAPDEKMRYLIPQYIYRHGTLPAGWDEEIRNELWGISYGFHPILPYIFGGYLMKLVGIFNSSDHALLMAARFINVLIGMGFYWYVLQIGKKLFHSKVFRAFFVALLALLPQLLYLFMYVNTDAIAVFSGALIIYYWLVGLERKWDRKACTGLAVGVSVCALSYFNAYGYALFSIIMFVTSLIVFYGKKGVKACTGIILKRGIFITVLFLLLTGWWFIRCAVLYDGDFLGLYTPDIYGEMYAQEEYKPSVKLSLAEQEVPLDEMLRLEDEGGMEWIRTTYRSTIGYFGFFEYALGIDIYEIHKRLLGLGAVGLFLHVGLGVLYYLKRILDKIRGKHSGHNDMEEKAAVSQKKKCSSLDKVLADFSELIEKPAYSYQNCKMHPVNFCILQFSLGCCIIIPIFLSLYYSYFSDFQPQGRYIMPMIVPTMYFVAKGVERFMTLFFKKWFMYLLMIPLFYAVLHVFLGAYVSVFIPAFVESLSSWADIRFPWFCNIGILNKLMSWMIPG